MGEENFTFFFIISVGFFLLFCFVFCFILTLTPGVSDFLPLFALHCVINITFNFSKIKGNFDKDIS